MYKFIRYFILGWRQYPDFVAYLNCFSANARKQLEEIDARAGIKPYKNRFDFAYRKAKTYYAHRDRDGRKCRKYHGDCAKCNAKHC